MKLILTFGLLLSLMTIKAFSSSVCYPGAKLENKTCFDLTPIDAKKLKYNNPFTDKSFPKNSNKNQYRFPIAVINLKSYDQNIKLLPNFGLKDFMSVSKGQYGIFSRQILGVMHEMRIQLNKPIRINSAFRAPTYNANIGGSAKWSRHQYGDAFDLSSSSASLNELVAICQRYGANYIDKYKSHVHCDWRAVPLEESFFGKPLKISDEVSFSSEAIIASKKADSQIIIDGNVRANGYVQLSSTNYEKEDAEDLYKKWVIVTPKGKWLEYEQSEVLLSLDEKGIYHIYHYIGANIRLDQTLEVR